MTDLVGSTALETRVGADLAHEIRVEHFELIRGAVEETGGRDVKNTGDGVLAVFDSATAGMSCAAAVQQRFDWRNRSAREQLLVKVGLSAGDATVAEDGDCFGMPVIEAARLCARCAGGQILAKDLVAQLAGGRGHTLKPVGSVELKGLPEPLTAVEVIWARRAQDYLIPLPPPFQQAPPMALAGRGEEARRLREMCAGAISGDPRLALLSGEPGSGKTSLASQVALEAHSQGAVVLLGRCEQELAVPYGPWIEALSHLVDQAPEAFLQSHVERHGGELSRLTPGLAARIPGLPAARSSDPETERYLLWAAVLGILRQAAEQDLLVLVLDDLHWADKTSLLLLRHILAHGQGMRALVVGLSDAGLKDDHPLSAMLADLGSEQGVERMTLGGLSQQEIVELMEHAAHEELDQAGLELAEELWQVAGGNPFYTGELLRELLETRVVYRQEDGQLVIRSTLAELDQRLGIREILGRRIARLGDDARTVLTAAAVIGRQFQLGLLVRVTGAAEDELLELLERATAAALLCESAESPGTFSFAHAIISHVLYQDADTSTRARLHRRVAEALGEVLGSQPGGRASELAGHWANAVTPADAGKALAYAEMAGAHALGNLAPHEALRWFTRAIELLGADGDAAQRCDLLIGFGEAQRQIADPGYRQTLLEASQLAFGLRDADRAGRAALANNRGHASVFGAPDHARSQALDQALELGQSANPARHATLISLASLELQSDREHSRRLALAEQALELARNLADARALAQVLLNYIGAVGPMDSVDRLRALVDELADCARAARDPALEFWATHQALTASAQSGEVEDAEHLLADLESAAAELAQPTLSWFARFPAAGWAIMRGELAHGERLAEQALEIGAGAGQPGAGTVHAVQLAQLRFYQGRGEEVIATLQDAVTANPGVPGWRAALAAGYSWLGQRTEAAALVEQAASQGFETPWDQFRMVALALYAEAAAQAGVTDAAAKLYELIEPWADQVIWNGVAGYGLCRTYLGLLAAALGWEQRADEHLAIAGEFHETKDMPMWAARCHLGWAESLAVRGESQRARSEALRAVELSREHGYAVIEQRAAAIAESHRPAEA